jgi:hypothetical protein
MQAKRTETDGVAWAERSRFLLLGQVPLMEVKEKQLVVVWSTGTLMFFLF